MNVVEQYWTGAVQRLQTEVDVFNKLIGHSGEQGRENELALARVLENLVPQRLGIGSGMVIDNASRRSKQSDIIVYDKGDQPSLMAQTSQVIFPVEVVHAVIEVKTTLTVEELADCREKKVELKKLASMTGGSPEFVVLAYSAWARPATVANHIKQMPDTHKPDLLCVLDPGIIAGSPNTVEADYPVALVPLHERDDSGARIAGKWTYLEKLPPTAVVQKYGSAYPVTIHPKKAVACEPGRALLLFLDEFMKFLAEKKVISEPALSFYLTETAREVLSM